ncbi:hypothetical protein Tco_0708092 [Tanacetum coccineum]
MSTQQDIYAASSKTRPPMLNKENYVPWPSCLLRYAKSRPNRKLIYNSIVNGPYVRRMIPKPGDADREVSINETFHEQTYDEVTEKELQQLEADDQAIQTILLGLPEDIYAAVDSSDYTQLYDFLKYNQKEVDDLRAERLAKTHDPLALMENSNNPFNCPVFHQDQPSSSTFMQQPLPNNNINPQPSFNQNYMQQPMPNPENITDPITAMNVELVLMAKAFKLNYSTPTNNNQRISSNPRNRQIAQPGMNMSQDRHMQMVGGNCGNQFRQYAGQNVGNQNGYNAVQIIVNHIVQNPGIQNAGNQNGLIVVSGIANQNQNPNGNGNVVAARAEGNAIGNNGDLDEIEEVNANCFVMANLQQASTSGTQIDNAPVYDSDGSAENDSNVIPVVSSVKQDGGIVEQHPATVEETRAHFESLYNNLAIKVEKANTVNRKLRETNNDLTTELASYKNQEKCFEISQENYDKLERCYQKSVYQEQCLTKKINALHLSSAKSTTTLNEEIANLNNQLSKERSTSANFKIRLLKEAAKFVRDFKSLAKEDDESLAKHKTLEFEIERLLRTVVSQDIMFIVQSNSVVDTSNL